MNVGHGVGDMIWSVIACAFGVSGQFIEHPNYIVVYCLSRHKNSQYHIDLVRNKCKYTVDRAVLSNGPAGPGPRAPRGPGPQASGGPQTEHALFFHLRNNRVFLLAK